MFRPTVTQERLDFQLAPTRDTITEHVPCLAEISGSSHATLVSFLSFVNLGL
jgi:hypothetical protein